MKPTLTLVRDSGGINHLMFMISCMWVQFQPGSPLSFLVSLVPRPTPSKGGPGNVRDKNCHPYIYHTKSCSPNQIAAFQHVTWRRWFIISWDFFFLMLTRTSASPWNTDGAVMFVVVLGNRATSERTFRPIGKTTTYYIAGKLAMISRECVYRVAWRTSFIYLRHNQKHVSGEGHFPWDYVTSKNSFYHKRYQALLWWGGPGDKATSLCN